MLSRENQTAAEAESIGDQIKVDAQAMFDTIIEQVIAVDECDVTNLLLDIDETCVGLCWLGHEAVCVENLELIASCIRAFPSLWKSAAGFAPRSIAKWPIGPMIKVWGAIESAQFSDGG